MKWLPRFIAGSLVAAISISIITLVISSTVLSNKFLLNELNKTDSYSKLSTDLVNNLTTDSNYSSSQSKAALTQVLTPSFLKQQLTQDAPQVESYYKGNSNTVPVINIAPAIEQAKSDGLVTLANDPLPKQFKLSSSERVIDIIQGFDKTMSYAIIASLVLLGLLLLVVWKQHRSTVLPDIVLSTGILVGSLGLIILVVPSVTLRYLQLNLNNGFDSVAFTLIKSVIHDTGKEFFEIGVVLFLTGAILRFILGQLIKPKPGQPS